MAKTGRLSDDPKTLSTRVRLSRGDIEKLDYCHQVLGLTKAAIIRQGIGEMYQKALKQK
ncbi:hypothetical protein CAFE_20680 [Caprobacter fermentans]|uniref:CopG family transcriptional regulator n=1 Tax=Caproicibacter fermentans TaxID=2576756 RepID=A0A6N8HZQ0_9FIRM|nr:hypothetical protein [Caproicibacter fermentans]MVB11354.1 hypothetical protein [Caproicibacter fermentans]